jgi:hypothetical protein
MKVTVTSKKVEDGIAANSDQKEESNTRDRTFNFHKRVASTAQKIKARSVEKTVPVKPKRLPDEVAQRAERVLQP